MLMVSSIAVASVALRFWPLEFLPQLRPPVTLTLPGGAPFSVEGPASERIAVALLSTPRRRPRVTSRPPAERLSLAVPTNGGTPEDAVAELVVPDVATLSGLSIGIPAIAAPTVRPARGQDDTSETVPAGAPAPNGGALARAFATAGRGIASGMRAAGAGIKTVF